MKASVVMCIRNVEKYINNCLQSILKQSYHDFEIIIIDDMSTDSTEKIIREINDKRIKYFRNEKWLGIPRSRNRGVKFAAGEYIFFTDGDCVVHENWIAEGLRYFEDPNCTGVEGKILYVSDGYEPTFSDCVLENKYGGNFMTGNMAYRKEAIEAVGGFDERLTYLEDRDIALRIMKHGKIFFNPEMVAYHPQVILTPKKLIETAARNINRVYLFKKTGERKFLLGRIFFPTNLIKILFPPIVFSSLLVRRFRHLNDFKLLPYMYIYAICERIQLWKTCATEKVFLI